MPQPPSWIVYGGLVLGVLGFLLSISTFFRDRPRVRLKVHWNVVRTSNPNPRLATMITAVNTGRRPVFVSRLHLELLRGPGATTPAPGKPPRAIVFANGEQGVTLVEGGEPHAAHTPQANIEDVVASRWWKVRGCAMGLNNRVYRSPPPLDAPAFATAHPSLLTHQFNRLQNWLSGWWPL